MVRNTAIRRCITFLLTLSMVVGAVCFAATPDTSPTPNQDLLNAMISGNRTWVIDTLVLDKRSTNPTAIALSANDESSLAKDALRHYYGIDMEGENAQAAYRTMVNAMYFAYNVDEYTKGFFDEVGELIGWTVGLFTGNEIKNTAETLNRTRQEIHYDNLLKSVFTADYTASDGTTLLDTEASLTMLKQLQEVVQYCTMLTNHVSAHNDMVADASSNLAIRTEYITDYALPYGDSASRVLTSIAELSTGGTDFENQKTAQIAADLALVANMAIHAPEGNFCDYAYFDFLGDYLEGSGVSEVMDLLNVPLDLTDTALEKYLFSPISATIRLRAPPSASSRRA